MGLTIHKLGHKIEITGPADAINALARPIAEIVEMSQANYPLIWSEIIYNIKQLKSYLESVDFLKCFNDLDSQTQNRVLFIAQTLQIKALKEAMDVERRKQLDSLHYRELINLARQYGLPYYRRLKSDLVEGIRQHEQKHRAQRIEESHSAIPKDLGNG